MSDKIHKENSSSLTPPLPSPLLHQKRGREGVIYRRSLKIWRPQGDSNARMLTYLHYQKQPKTAKNALIQKVNYPLLFHNVVFDWL